MSRRKKRLRRLAAGQPVETWGRLYEIDKPHVLGVALGPGREVAVGLGGPTMLDALRVLGQTEETDVTESKWICRHCVQGDHDECKTGDGVPAGGDLCGCDVCRLRRAGVVGDRRRRQTPDARAPYAHAPNCLRLRPRGMNVTYHPGLTCDEAVAADVSANRLAGRYGMGEASGPRVAEPQPDEEYGRPGGWRHEVVCDHGRHAGMTCAVYMDAREGPRDTGFHLDLRAQVDRGAALLSRAVGGPDRRREILVQRTSGGLDIPGGGLLLRVRGASLSSERGEWLTELTGQEVQILRDWLDGWR